MRMVKILKPKVVPETEETDLGGGYFQVWIDVNCGVGIPSWWWNSPPKQLPAALDEAAACRMEGVPARIVPAGYNPRPDGRWDNPA